MRRAIWLDTRSVVTEAIGDEAERVMARVCAGLRSEPADAQPRLRLRSPVASSPQKEAASFELERDGATIERAPSAGAAVEALMRELSMLLVTDYADGLALHAAALERDGQILLLPAPSGRGKSTLATYAGAHGFRLLSDEAVFVPSGTIAVLPLARPVHLKPASCFLLDEPPLSSSRGAVERYPGGALIDLDALGGAGGRFDRDSAPSLALLLFPRYVGGSTQESEPRSGCRLDKLSPGSTAFELLQALVNARNLAEDGVPEAARIASGLPGYRLEYRSLKDALNVLERLSAELVQPGRATQS